MRKIILLITCMFSISVFSQIKVLKNESLVEIGKDNSVGLYKKEDKFTINYQDLNTSNLNTIRSFSFQNLNGDVSGLYKLIMEGFVTAIPDENIILELPNDIIELHYEKNYGQQTLQFIQIINKNRKYIGKSQFLTQKQVEKIFGKTNGKYALYEKSAVVNSKSGPNTASTATPRSTGGSKKSKK
ncbi:hypothetical protein MP478_01375 [Chryseobacterium sp. WG14]|uniref:hypothetical protein n=1 Tax=unclassified Chryseobacterium TaxID=2593645 RepID=UPI001D847187|nr:MULTISPECIES: hypothetical protein [unclassified Chryseobacterium]MCQ9634309.1 hypothetical protein [Chryseobacterium sp. WG23]MCQ9638023.1 hypothetical protein [Chryseobacterium sp. WG14]CAH0189041.1 hypothetical protein SRABI04_01691 [Chryseobacterium sp. Bi04]